MIREFMKSATKKDFAIITTANERFLNELEKKGVQIISNSVTISLDADGGHVKGTLILDGPIGKEVPISSEHMASTRHNE